MGKRANQPYSLRRLKKESGVYTDPSESVKVRASVTVPRHKHRTFARWAQGTVRPSGISYAMINFPCNTSQAKCLPSFRVPTCASPSVARCRSRSYTASMPQLHQPPPHSTDPAYEATLVAAFEDIIASVKNVPNLNVIMPINSTTASNFGEVPAPPLALFVMNASIISSLPCGNPAGITPLSHVPLSWPRSRRALRAVVAATRSARGPPTRTHRRKHALPRQQQITTHRARVSGMDTNVRAHVTHILVDRSATLDGVDYRPPPSGR
ncbi:hypothetical protein B0H10DRAFT_2212936 [Mycena sp. CBHHK59/15]|nr:hypothetical protein B0H10DRAFT_2212936 [Mycena sp. CBHHK59/15]